MIKKFELNNDTVLFQTKGGKRHHFTREDLEDLRTIMTQKPEEVQSFIECLPSAKDRKIARVEAKLLALKNGDETTGSEAA